VRQQHDGIDLDDLDRVWQREHASGKTIKLLYLVPNFQNPTGVLMSAAKRGQVVAWAARRDLLVIEDDPYGSLYFEDVATAADTRPMRADDPSVA
jgi:2-aminoadipate transaminase